MTQVLFPHTWQRLLDGDALSFGGFAARNFAVDIHDNDSEYRIVAELPGVAKEHVSVQVENNVLHIRTKTHDGESDNAQNNLLLNERFAGEKARAFRLSNRVDAKNIHAELKDGVLTITLPKAADAVSRNISIN